jgi:hypothetical protein
MSGKCSKLSAPVCSVLAGCPARRRLPEPGCRTFQDYKAAVHEREHAERVDSGRNYSRLRSHLCAGNAMIGGKSGPDLDGGGVSKPGPTCSQIKLTILRRGSVDKSGAALIDGPAFWRCRVATAPNRTVSAVALVVATVKNKRFANCSVVAQRWPHHWPWSHGRRWLRVASAPA